MSNIIETTEIGKNFKLGEFSIVRKNVTIGNDVDIREFCVIGCTPFTLEKNSPVRIPPKGNIVIGNNVFINAQSDVVMGFEKTTIVEDDVVMGQRVIIGHDSHIHKKAHIMNSCILNGYVTIGENTMLGSGVNIRNRITIGKNTVVGMGSVVVKDIPDNVIAYGNPCEVHGKNDLTTKIIRKVTKEVKKVI